MQNILKNKILIILSIFLILIFNLYTFCFAADVTIEDTNYQLSDFVSSYYNKSIVMYRFNETCFFLFLSDTPLVIDKSNAVVTNLDNTEFYKSFGYKVDISSMLLLDKSSFSFLKTFSDNPLRYAGNILYSTTDVYDTEGNVVFQGAPQPKVELMKATQVEEIPQQITRVVLIVLPIFLLIFGIFLVLYLIKSKNLLNL